METHGAFLQTFAWRLCGERATAEDLVFRTVERALTAPGEFADETARRAWLCRVCINFHRMDARRKAYNALVFSDQPPEVEDAALGPADAVLLASDAAAVRTAVSRLPPDLREVVVLFYFADYSVAEIGQMLETPAGTVKYLLFAARRALQEDLRQLQIPTK